MYEKKLTKTQLANQYMKNIKLSTQPSKLTADSQNRLLAYSTAASLGAFFAGQNAGGAVLQAPGLAPYPLVVLPQPVGSTNETDHYLSIEGGSTTNFNLLIWPDLLSHPTEQWPAQLVDLRQFIPDTNNPSIVNGQALAPLQSDGSTNAYISAFLGGMVVGNPSNTTIPWYGQRLALSYNAGSSYPWINYAWSNFSGFPSEYLGFEFTSGVDGKNHFGYMDVQVNFTSATVGTLTKQIVESVVIKDCRYETTPDTGITIPSAIKITSFTQDPSQNNLITIDFGPNWPDDNTSTYVLETSPTLGPSATWTQDTQAVVYQTATADSDHAATYQALTYPATGATAQYWRIRKQ